MLDACLLFLLILLLILLYASLVCWWLPNSELNTQNSGRRQEIRRSSSWSIAALASSKARGSRERGKAASN